MNILVTGANGQLGLSLREWAQNSINTYTFTDVSRLEGYDVSYLDITDISAIRQMVKEKNIKCIINCAAWTDVDGAEDPSKYETVERLNAKAPENLAIAMKEVGGLLIHVSTDYVFGGAQYNTPCKEDQKGTPTGIYGLTKLHGEQLKKQVLWNALVATAKKRGTLDLIEAEDIREIFDEIESSPVMETLWKTYQKNYSYAANVSWHIIMEFIRDLYQTTFSDKFKADFL